MNDLRGALKWLVWGMALLSGRVVFAAPQISASSPSGPPGSTVMVAVSFATDVTVSSVRFDLAFSTNYFSCDPPILGSALSDHLVVSSQPSPGIRRVQIYSFTSAPLSSGVLVFLPLTVATNAPDHDELLSLTNVLDPVVANPVSAVLAISPRPIFTSITKMADGAVHLQMSGSATRTYQIEFATNLVSAQWTALETNSPLDGTLVFDDASAGPAPVRFYRATLVR